MDQIKIPRHLSKQSKAFFKQITEDFELENHHIALLEQACVMLSRAAEARQLIASQGLTLQTKTGLRTNPAVKIESEAMVVFARLMREIGLDAGPLQPDNRPPRLFGKA